MLQQTIEMILNGDPDDLCKFYVYTKFFMKRPITIEIFD